MHLFAFSRQIWHIHMHVHVCVNVLVWKETPAALEVLLVDGGTVVKGWLTTNLRLATSLGWGLFSTSSILFVVQHSTHGCAHFDQVRHESPQGHGGSP